MGMNSKGVELDGRNEVLDWAPFNDIMALSNDFVFNMLVQMAGSDCNSLLCLVDCKLRCKSGIYRMSLICQNLLNLLQKIALFKSSRILEYYN